MDILISKNKELFDLLGIDLEELVRTVSQTGMHKVYLSEPAVTALDLKNNCGCLYFTVTFLEKGDLTPSLGKVKTNGYAVYISISAEVFIKEPQ